MDPDPISPHLVSNGAKETACRLPIELRIDGPTDLWAT